VSEIVPPKDRGMLVDIHAVALNGGYLIAGYVGVGFYHYSGGNQWRAAMGLSMLFPTIVLIGINWMPESPRYLLSKGRNEEAWAIVNRLHSSPSDPNNEFAKREFYQMSKQIEFERTMKTSYIEIFRKPSYRKRAFITMWYTFSLMSSGVLVINSKISPSLQ
jgi:MFS family permease